MKVNFFFILLFLISSCSINVVENLNGQEEFTIKPKDQSKFCPLSTNFSLFNDGITSQQLFDQFIQRISEFYTLSAVDKMILWTFVQINNRPDLASPHASIEMKVQFSSKGYYFHSLAKNKETFPVFYLLDHLLKKFNSKYTLKELSLIFDKNFKGTFIVNDSFSRFLQKNKKDLEQSSFYKRIYFRGDDVLRKGERIPLFSFYKIYQQYKKSILVKDNYQIETDLFQNVEKNLYCNQEVTKEKKSQILKDINPSYFYGMTIQNTAFIATTSMGKIHFNKDRHEYFSGEPQNTPNTYCKFKNNWIISGESRDSMQHIQHMMEYGLTTLSTPKEFNTLSLFSRHILLKSPERLIFESSRSTPKQIDKMNQLNIPLYSVRKLGHVIQSIQTSGKKYLILDQRHDEQLLCK